MAGNIIGRLRALEYRLWCGSLAKERYWQALLWWTNCSRFTEVEVHEVRLCTLVHKSDIPSQALQTLRGLGSIAANCGLWVDPERADGDARCQGVVDLGLGVLSEGLLMPLTQLKFKVCGERAGRGEACPVRGGEGCPALGLGAALLRQAGIPLTQELAGRAWLSHWARLHWGLYSERAILGLG